MMSCESDDSQPLDQKDLIFILALAGRIDAQARMLAQRLEKNRIVYYSYAVMDSISSSYSLFKYFFDVCIGGSADDLHELMLTPEAIAFIVVETTFLVGYSVLACHFYNVKEDNYKKDIAESYQYVRDLLLKAPKNAFKGWRSVVMALRLMGLTDMTSLTIPVGIGLGIIAALNRYIIRSTREERKQMMVTNKKLFLALAGLSSLTDEELAVFSQQQGQIQYQSEHAKNLGYFSSAVGGVIDGLYLYAGILTLCALSPQVLLAMGILSAFYMLGCIITRVAEEYEFQVKLEITQTKCLLVVTTKQLQTYYAQLRLLEEKEDLTEVDKEKIKDLKEALCRLINEFDAQRHHLIQQSSASYSGNVLAGLKNGLYAYGALLSILFMASIFLTLAGVAFSPPIVVITACLGLALIAGFSLYSVAQHYQHRQSMPLGAEGAYNQLLQLRSDLEECPEQPVSLNKEDLNESLQDGLSISKASSSSMPEKLEVARSFFSGVGKGQKFVDFAGNPLQELESDGHYHDTPVMYVLGGFSALLFGSTLGLRSLARGFGRPAAEDSDLSCVVSEPKKESDINDLDLVCPGSYPCSAEEPQETKNQGGSLQNTHRTDSPNNATNLLSLFGFFNQRPIAESTPPIATINLVQQTDSDSSTIVGLN